MNPAPVADVSPPAGGGVLAGRIYPGPPEQVAALTTAALRAHARARVAATVKHFPGLGRATVNTDDGSATIDASRAELEAADLEPFRAAVAADAPLVMAGHALYPAFDADDIASQSRTLLTDVLRGQLGFRGVTITDSIEAQAVLDRSGVATAAVRSIAAGADIVLMTGSGSWNLVYPRLLRAARRSPTFRARIHESAARVLALKRRLGLRAAP
jgi:beta-N-acetylhexosaminidase